VGAKHLLLHLGTKLIKVETAKPFRHSVFEGYTCVGISRTGISRGPVAWDQGDNRAKVGDGDFVARKPFTAVHQANAVRKGVTQPKGVKRVDVVP
jgi:dihydropyrimidinase